MLKDLQELNEETMAEIGEVRKEMEAGIFLTHEQLKRELGF